MAITEQPYDINNFTGAVDPPLVLHPGSVWNGQPCISLSDDGIRIAGSLDQMITVTDKFGVYLSGQLSLSATPDQILIGGGYWTLNPLLLTSIPSTSATPIPTLVPNTPPLLQSQSDVSSICSNLEGSL